ncbi:MAG: tetratricopeptide repeat protein [Chloroflexi bacterium]|nr:tetratricopeptide repeat protein [Chloroflexota bacterium]
MNWQQIIEQTKPEFEKLRAQKEEGELPLEDAPRLEECADVLEAACGLGLGDIPRSDKVKRYPLLEMARWCIPYASHEASVFALHSEILLELGDIDRAAQFALQARRLTEQNPGIDSDTKQYVLYVNGNVQVELRQSEEAAHLYELAIQARPDSKLVPMLIEEAAAAYADAGLYSRSNEFMERIPGERLGHWLFQQLLAENYERLGKWDEAIGVYRRLSRQATGREAIEHLFYRIGFCEARRDSKRGRPTGARAGLGFDCVSLPDDGGEHKGQLTEDEKTRLHVTKGVESLRRLIEAEVSLSKHAAVIRPGEQASNLSRLKDTLLSCAEYIWWADLHFDVPGLRLLSEVADSDRIKSIRVLCLLEQVPKLKKPWGTFEAEMANRGIKAECRTISTRLFHDRFIIGANVVFNVPPVTAIVAGKFGEILGSPNRPPFEDWWQGASPIR